VTRTSLITSICFLCALLFFASACEESAPKSYTSFGAEINPDGAMSVATVIGDSGLDGQTVKVSGTIREVCQKRGCWMTIDAGKEESMRITFKDYAFFVPKNAGGYDAIVEGTLNLEELSVETLRHFAEEAGKSESEVEDITEPSTQLSLIADGVLIAGIEAQEETAAPEAQGTAH
jgi:hypothetical protein